MRVLLLASTNSNKLREIKEIIGQIPFKIISLSDIHEDLQVEETGKTIRENALIKAKFWAVKTHKLVLAEDSGLEVDALGGRPGVYSSRYGKTDKDRIEKLLVELKDIPDEKRTARFRTVAVICYLDKNKKIIYKEFEGLSEGKITHKPIGDNGFGYDPIFYNFDLKKTNAQASVQEKNMASHRGKAIFQIKEYLLSL